MVHAPCMTAIPLYVWYHEPKMTIPSVCVLHAYPSMFIEMDAYYIPQMSMRLLSPQAYFYKMGEGHAIVKSKHVQLC